MDLKGLGGTWKGFSDQELSDIKQTSPVNKTPPSAVTPHQAPVTQSTSEESTLAEEDTSCDKEPCEPRSCDLVELSSKLEEQQKRQREMEEENIRKKKVLEEALVQRYDQSRVESSKLERVHDELKRLDQLVSRDVLILRDRIEAATKEYNHARTRFDSAEREYVTAKLSLASTRERKELLSEHLCAVIQQNEGRKAAKLSELMREMNITEPSQ